MLSDDDILNFNGILQSASYKKYTQKRGEKKQNNGHKLKIVSENFVNRFLDFFPSPPNKLQREGMKNGIPFNFLDVWTRLEILRGFKLSEHANSLTDASNLKYQLYSKSEIQKEQQYRNAFDK